MASQGFESSVAEVGDHPEEALMAAFAKGGQDAVHDPLFDGEFPEDTPGEPDAPSPSSLTLNQELFGEDEDDTGFLFGDSPDESTLTTSEREQAHTSPGPQSLNQELFGDDDDLFGDSQDEQTLATGEGEPAHTSPAPLFPGLALPRVSQLALPTNSSASRVEQAKPTQSEVAPATTTSTPPVEPTSASRFPGLALPRLQPLALPTLPPAPRVEQAQPAPSEAPVASPATGPSSASPSTVDSEPTGATQAPEAPQGSRKRKRDDEAGEPASSKKSKKSRKRPLTLKEQCAIEEDIRSTEVQIQTSRLYLPADVARHSTVVSPARRAVPKQPKKGSIEHPIEIREGEAGPAPREEPSLPSPPPSSPSEAGAQVGSSSQNSGPQMESNPSGEALPSSPASAVTPPSSETCGTEVDPDDGKTAAERHGSLEKQMAEYERNPAAYTNSHEKHADAKREKKRLKMQEHRAQAKARKEAGL